MSRFVVFGVLCWLSLSSVAQAACDTKTYMPLGTRSYQMDSAAGTSTLSVKTTPLSGGRLNVETTANGKTTAIIWTCNASGMSASIPTGTGGGQISFDAGFLPDTARWKVGFSWKSSGQVNAASGAGSMKMTTATTSKIARQEKITTPAGTFMAFRVNSTITVKMNLPTGTKLPPGMDMNKLMGGPVTASAWYARGVGLIKTSSANGDFEMVLTKIGK